VQVEENVQQTRPDPTDQVKEEVRDVPEKILNVVAEDPEKEHVSGDVPEVGVKEHAGDQGHERYFKAGMSREESRESGRDRRVGKEKGFIGPVRKGGFKADLVDKNGDVGEDQRDIDEGIGPRWVEVFERDEHGNGSAAE
jgi:hypothetical protein